MLRFCSRGAVAGLLLLSLLLLAGSPAHAHYSGDDDGDEYRGPFAAHLSLLRAVRDESRKHIRVFRLMAGDLRGTGRQMWKNALDTKLQRRLFRESMMDLRALAAMTYTKFLWLPSASLVDFFGGIGGRVGRDARMIRSFLAGVARLAKNEARSKGSPMARVRRVARAASVLLAKNSMAQVLALFGGVMLLSSLLSCTIPKARRTQRRGAAAARGPGSASAGAQERAAGEGPAVEGEGAGAAASAVKTPERKKDI